MSKKSCFRSPFNRQHGKWSQDPLKSARQHLYHIYWSLWWKLSWRKSLLVICKILGLFLNTLTAVDEYSLLYSNNLTKPIQMELFKKQKTVCQLFAACLKFWTFWKKNAHVFPKWPTGKDVVRQMSKKSCFRTPFNRQHGKRSQILWKLAWQHVYHIYWSLRKILNWKNSLLVICKILELFLNTLTADDRYSLLSSNNLTQPIQIFLSKKQIFFSEIFSAIFLNVDQILNIF